MKDPVIKKWNDDITSGDQKRASMESMDMINRQSTKTLQPAAMDPKYAQTVWEKNNAIMEKYNKPGQFTAFIGYEWTSNYNGGNNLHRNIIYRGDAKEANQVTPYTTFQSDDPESLWKWMEAYEQKTGGKILAIPHNGNLSNGLMFAQTTLSGKPLTKEYAIERQKWEILYEVTQVKGTGETHPSLSPTDEFANFEIWDRGNLILQPETSGSRHPDAFGRRSLRKGRRRGGRGGGGVGGGSRAFGHLGADRLADGLARGLAAVDLRRGGDCWSHDRGAKGNCPTDEFHSRPELWVGGPGRRDWRPMESAAL